MKFITTFIILILSLNAFGAEQTISPKLGSQFGKIISIEATFVEKPNDYHSRNMITEPFLISVSSVNGKALLKPMVMEYIADPKINGLKKDQHYKLLAYETIYTMGGVRGWDEEVSQVDYRIIHRLVIKKPTQANQAIEATK